MLALIGFDCVPAALLARLEAEGRVPRLTEIRASATAVALETPGRDFPAGVFPTLWSGVPLQEHGIHYPFMWDATGQRVRVGDAFPFPPLMWERVSRAGGRVLVVDPYEAPSPGAVNGLVIAGWQFRNRVVLRPSSSPGGSRRRWQRRLGRAPRGEEVFGEADERTLRGLRDVLVAGPARLADLAVSALAEVKPDLFVATFPSIHVAGHRFFDPGSVVQGITPAAATELQAVLERVVVEADAALGRIVDALPPGADVIVYSPLGMVADTSRTDVLGSLLSAVLDGRARGGGGADAAWVLRAAVPTQLRARIASALPDRVANELAARFELRGTDWSRTRAFSVPSDTSGLVRLNLRGRERAGIVAPDEAAALVDEIRSGLADFAFEDGAPLVTEVVAVSEAYGGAAGSHLLPDLIVRWSDRPARRGEIVLSSRFGEMRRDGPGSGRSGNHSDDAWALVRPGSGRAAEVSRADICDLAATALARFGLAAVGRPLVDPS